MSAAPSMLADFPRTRRRLRYREYVALVQQGYFADEKLELIEGELIEMSPATEPHATSILLALSALNAAFGPGYLVRPQMPLGLPFLNSVPEPDLAVVRGSPRDFAEWPSTALLVVEAAVTSLTYDLGPKATLYAAGGVTDYWVIDLPARKLHVHRDPDPATGRYRQVRAFDESASVMPLHGSSPVSIAALLP